MKRVLRKAGRRILSLFLVCVLLAEAAALFRPVPVSAAGLAAEREVPEPTVFYYQHGSGKKNAKAVCRYSDSLFEGSGEELDPHLRTMSLAMAMSSFMSYREDKTDYTDRCENFEKLMDSIGFTDVYHNASFDRKPTRYSIGVAIARKQVAAGEKKYTVLAVGVRGAAYETEWAGNVLVGKNGQARGFAYAASQVLSCIRTYERKHGITENAKIWIAGFSRAGAVSNLVGEELNADPGRYATTRRDIYCYTFEAPQPEVKSTAPICRNIHNTVSPADVVPMIVPSAWGFGRVGHPVPGHSGSYVRDDTLIPTPGTEGYEQKKEAMLKKLAELDPEAEYVIDSFSAYRWQPSSGETAADGSVSVAEKEEISQSEFLSEFVGWLNGTLPKNAREAYADEYEEAFSELVRVIMQSGPEQKEKIVSGAWGLLKDWTFYLSTSLMVLIIRGRDTYDEEEYRSLMVTYGEALGAAMVRHMKEEGAGLPEEDYNAFIKAMGMAVRFADAAIEDDFTNYSGYHFVTMLANVEPIIQAHNAMVSYAWMQSMDSWYDET